MTDQENGPLTLGELSRMRGPAPARRRTLNDRPYWMEALPAREANAAMLPPSCDVAVVGAGFTGLSAALTLARRGRSVVLLDADKAGYGASIRNGGQIGSGNQKFRVKTLLDRFGEKKTTALLREGVAMLDNVERLVRDEAIDCHFVRSGRFRGAVRPQHYEAMARDMEDLRRYAGVDSFAVPRAEQAREIATDYFYGGSVLPGDAGLHPGLLHEGLLARVKTAGVAVADNTPVRAIEAAGDGFEVVAGALRLRARNVIVATNGYTAHLDRYITRRIVPVGSAIIATDRMAPERIDALMPTRRVYGITARLFYYFRPAPDEPRLLWGGRAAHMYPKGSPAAFGHLARHMLKVFPDLADVTVSQGWTGKLGFTFDDFPHLGRTPGGVHFAMGYCGTGVSRSLYFGEKIALQVMDDPQGRTAFDEFGFPGHVFSAFSRPAVPVVENWYRLLDQFG